MRAADRIYRTLLRLYPREFRDEYGAEMTQTFRDDWADDPRPRRWLELATTWQARRRRSTHTCF